MTGCHEARPLLPARAEELTPLQAQARANHVMACSRCAAEAAAYSRLGHALAVLGGLEADPPDGTLERLLVAIGRRRVADPRVVVAAGSAGALVATIVVAHALRQRSRRHLGGHLERVGPWPLYLMGFGPRPGAFANPGQ